LMSRLGSVSVPPITCEGLICNASVCMLSYSPNGTELSTSELMFSWQSGEVTQKAICQALAE
jgi:hypothetical protein